MVDQNTPQVNQPDPSNIGNLIITGFTGNARLLIRRISENSTIEIVSTYISGTQTTLGIAFPSDVTPKQALRDLAFGLNEFDVTVQGMNDGSVPVLVVALSPAKTLRRRFVQRALKPKNVERTQIRAETPSPILGIVTTPIPTSSPVISTSPQLSEIIAENIIKIEIAANTVAIIGRVWQIIMLIGVVTMPLMNSFVRRSISNLVSQAKILGNDTQDYVSTTSRQIVNRGKLIISLLTLVISIAVDGIFGSTHDDNPKQ
ncbi:MAG: hypothetical protein HQ477_12450 [Chloroflexi bacterium]|nr:hypothetical protein [Chloroflexota bacterium]